MVKLVLRNIRYFLVFLVATTPSYEVPHDAGQVELATLPQVQVHVALHSLLQVLLLVLDLQASWSYLQS